MGTEGRHTDRIIVLDILRGCALLIMVIAHVADETGRSSGFGPVVGRWIAWFVSTKGMTIFAILFGASFALVLDRADTPTRSVVGPFLRRLGGIAAFGAIAQGVFGYAILLEYAVTALPLLALRRWSVRALVIVALAVPGYHALTQGVIGAYEWSTMGLEGANAAYRAPRPPAPRRPPAEIDLRGADRTARIGSSFAASAGSRLRHYWGRLWEWPSVFRPFDVRTFGLFLIGMLGIRAGVFERPASHRALIVAAMLFGLVNWTSYWWGWSVGTWSVAGIPDRMAAAVVSYVNGWLIRPYGQFLALTYIGVILLLASYSPRFEQRLAAVASAGRLALTNYMAQIVIISVVFSSWGLGWSGLHREFAPAVGVVLFGGLVLFSRAWLTWFSLGPAEWVLRSATYARLEPLRRSRPLPEGR
jgi:uncharacterized protein